MRVLSCNEACVTAGAFLSPRYAQASCSRLIYVTREVGGASYPHVVH